ncbi:hypothetical protein ABPG74_004992 [Tetrahymena malaccensis]
MSQIHQKQGEISSQINEEDQQQNATLSQQNTEDAQENQNNQQINQKIEVSSPIHLSNNQTDSVLTKQNQAKHIQTVQLICEDRNNQKKCCFPSIQLETQDISDKINVFNLLNSSLSVKSFLKGNLIFVEQDGMDIALGLFPFEMDKSYELPLSLIGNKLSAKIMHLRVQSNKKSQYNHKKLFAQLPEKNAQGSNQNKQYRKKESESLIDQDQVHTTLNDDTKQEYTSSQRKISSSYSSNQNYCSSYSSEINSQCIQESINDFIEDEEAEDIEDDECMEEIINLGKLKRNRVSNTSSSGDYTQGDKHNQSESKPFCRKSKVIVTDDNCDDEEGSHSSCSKSSLGIQKKIHKEKVQITKTISSNQKGHLSQKIKGEEYLPHNLNGELNANTTAQSLSLVEQAPKKRRRQTLNKRSHERTIREGIQLVTQWRNSHEYYKSKNQVKDLQEVAKDMGISKKTLDYYYLELRTAEFFNFDFDQHLNQRMGFLRQFIEDETKKFQDSNQQAKIPRQLNFKYRLPEHRGNHNVSSSSQLATSNNNNINMQFLQNQQSGHIYLPNENFGTQNHQMIYNNSNHSHHHHHHHANMNNFQSNHQSHFNNQIKQNNQSISPIINQQQKLNQILQQQQQQQLNIQNSNNSNNNNNQIQQIDANSTSSLSVFNQTTHHDSSLNQSDHNFLNSQPTIQHFSTQSQPTQIFHGYSQDCKNNADSLRVDHNQSQILDYQLSNGQNYQNFNIQSNQIQQDDFKPLLQYSEQQQQMLGDQLNSSLLNTQSNNMSRFLSQQNQMIALPSTHSISDSTQNLAYQSNRLQNQQQIVKQNPDFLHPYEQKQQNEGYKLFLEKQKQLKLQEQLAEDCAMQQMFE